MHEPVNPLEPPGAVACLAVPEPDQWFAFATGGVGSIKLWNSDGECLQTIAAPPGMSPRALITAGPDVLAAIFAQARPFDPNAFRLDPPNAIRSAMN